MIMNGLSPITDNASVDEEVWMLVCCFLQGSVSVAGVKLLAPKPGQQVAYHLSACALCCWNLRGFCIAMHSRAIILSSFHGLPGLPYKNNLRASGRQE